MQQLAIFFFVVLCETVGSEDFSYKDPNTEWGEEYSTCNGNNQSPIDIPFDQDTAEVEDQKLKFNEYDNTPDSMEIVNNGHTLQVNIVWSSDSDRPYLSGGPLDGEYVLEQFRFHWGQNDSVGSEHMVNGQSTAMELHVVHWKRDYGSLQEAAKHPDGLAVIAVFYAVNDGKSTKGLKEIWKHLGELREENSRTEAQPFKLIDLLPNTIGDTYVSYHGSLTAPPCNEIVTWLIAVHSSNISPREMQEIRGIELANGDDHNNRPVQDLGDRKPAFYFSSS